MIDWLLIALLALIVLVYLEVLDVFDFLSSVLRPTGALLIGIASLIVWASRKLLGQTTGGTRDI